MVARKINRELKKDVNQRIEKEFFKAIIVLAKVVRKFKS
jgi:hypothetical protein